MMLSQEDFYQFQYFVAEWLLTMGRTEVILKERQEDEIIAIAKTLDELDAEFDLLDWAHTISSEIDQIKDTNNLDQFMNLPMSPAKYLAYCIEKNYLDLSEQPHKVELEEYFAVLSMALIGQACCEQEGIEELSLDNKSEKQAFLKIGQSVIGATEAITYAEALIMSKRAEKAAAKREQVKRSDNARKAGKASQEKTNILVKDLYKFFIEKGYENYTQATEEFLKTIPEERYRHLMPSNRNRTLRERLSRLVRGLDTV
ncbi:MAG: hypothetical protein AB2665_06845 [Candidatus Thiodiazotropha sp.]